MDAEEFVSLDWLYPKNANEQQRLNLFSLTVIGVLLLVIAYLFFRAEGQDGVIESQQARLDTLYKWENLRVERLKQSQERTRVWQLQMAEYDSLKQIYKQKLRKEK
jgi:hypothetical protein